MASFTDLQSSDPFGPVCINAADLDAAFARADKPTQVPRTCLPADTPRDLGVLEDALGHRPNMLEQTQFLTAWDYLNGGTPDWSVYSKAPKAPPGQDTCTKVGSECCHSVHHHCLPVTPVEPVVPLPPASVLLISALLAVGVAKALLRAPGK